MRRVWFLATALFFARIIFAVDCDPKPLQKTKIKIVVVDDHPLVRAGIRRALTSAAEMNIIGEASDGREGLSIVNVVKPDVLLMDISMPGLNGLEATARVTRDYPNVKVIMLTQYTNEEYFWASLKAGAVGYLYKTASTEEIAEAVRRVMSGEIYVSAKISKQMMKKFPLQQAAIHKTPLEKLTDRQREILQLIAEGQTTKSIAFILQVSPKTVEYHRAKLMESLSVFDVPGLVRFAVASGLVGPL